MIYLFLHVVLLSGFGIFLKDAENRGHRLDPIGLVNYATAFVFSCALAYRTNSFTFTPLTLVFGLATGISYAFGFVLVVAGMRLSGIVVTTAVIGLSIASGATLGHLGMPAFVQPAHLLAASLLFGLQFLIWMSYRHSRDHSNQNAV